MNTAQKERRRNQRHVAHGIVKMAVEPRTFMMFAPPNDIEFSGEEEGARATDDESAATRG
jgi:hypothetical protein